jgi:hypothetical protein
MVTQAKCGDSGGVNNSGAPCQRRCSPGFTRCNLHGGALPSAKIKAEQALAQARIPSCEALFHIVNQFLEQPCPTCGYPTGDTDIQRTVIRAAQVILDRTGMGPHSTIELTKQSDGELDLATPDAGGTRRDRRTHRASQLDQGPPSRADDRARRPGSNRGTRFGDVIPRTTRTDCALEP